MTTPRFTQISESLYRLDRPPEGMAERVRRRHCEAQMLAREHIEALMQALGDARTVADIVSRGGEVYPASVRDVVMRLQSALAVNGQTLEALMERIPEPRI